MKSKIIVCIGLCILLFQTGAEADDWVNEWISGSTYSRPNTYNTQRRNYVTGGNLSLRHNMGNDHLVSISSPSFKKGCGGIDVFGGSFSFLNADRLVDKFERIGTDAVATYAYDLVLNVLCEPCAKELKSLEALIDRLNQLQLDDCKASKAIVAVAEEYSGFGDSQKTSEAVADFLVSTGAVDSYTDLTDSGNNQNANAVLASTHTPHTKADLVSDCPATLKNIFFTEGTILENIADEMGISTDNIQLMRAMVGDVYISSNLEYAAIPPCPQNNPTNISSIIFGDFYSRSSGSCVQDQIVIDGTSFASLYEWAKGNIIEIADAMTNREPLSGGNVAFINTIPHPILVQITTDIVMQGNDFNAEQMADSYAYMASLIFAYSMMRDLYNDLHNMLTLASVANINQVSEGLRCQTSISSKAEGIVKKMMDRVFDYSAAIKLDYQSELARMNGSSEFVKLLRDQQQQAALTPLRKVHE